MANTRLINPFIREQTVKISLVDGRPNTKMNVFFGDTKVTHLCFPESTPWKANTAFPSGAVIKSGRNYYKATAAITTGSTAPTHTTGTVSNLQYASTLDVVTNNNGQVVFEFNIPASTYETGNFDVIVTDVDVLSDLTVLGSVGGSAKAVFSATKRYEVDEPLTVTSSPVTLINPPNAGGDPLAQSFFTYGVEGGIFITSIDVYFQTKDSSIPVRMELRPMVNGYPAPLDVTNPALVSVVAAADVKISTNASLPTKFTFPYPVYVKGDSDYCFVLKTNSTKYNVFTSRLGETSIETKAKIYEQPYIGSVFKSENNITWTAEQMEDLKFTIHKAEFDTTATATVVLDTVLESVAAYGDQFTTTSGTSVVRYRHPQDHGLELGSKIDIISYSGGTYNGIDSSKFTGSFNVSKVVDRNTVEFEINGVTATSSGTIDTSNIITYVEITNEGANYTNNCTVVFTGGGGTGATANAVVVGGNIKKIVITNPGTGYTSAPSVTVVPAAGSTGSGFAGTASVIAAFNVTTNKPFTGFKTNLGIYNFDTTTTTSKLITTLGNYDGGNITTYAPGRDMYFEPNYSYANINQNSLIASTSNEVAKMSGNNSSKIVVELTSKNKNLTPMINLNEQAILTAYYNSINKQSDETINASTTNSTGSVDSIIITNPGSAYIAPPTVVISAPDLADGVQATAAVTIAGGEIDSVTITEAGSGYTSTPLITLVNDITDDEGFNGALQAVLTPFNTELLPTGGTAKARYITKKTNLQLVSTGVRLISAISSIPGASVDWYIRTSLSSSSVVHEQQPWQYLSCDVERNKSSSIDEVYEYEFKLDDIAGYDTYDLKCVLSAEDPTKAPVVHSYRVIVVA